MAKKVTGYVKLQIEAGKATPAPPVGTALGPQGVNIMDFCKAFNAKTAKDAGLIIPVVVTVYSDRSYSFITKTPPAAVLLKKAAKLETGSGVPNKTKVGKVTKKQVEEIAKLKLVDLNTVDLAAAVKSVEGTARSMGIEVVGCRRDRSTNIMSGKKFTAAAAKVDKAKIYDVPQAVALVKSAAFAKFNETVEVALRLGVDPKHADQMVRGTVVLPHGLGKTTRVAVVASGEKIKEAEAAGADLVGGDDLVAKIQGGMIDFEALVATPGMRKWPGRP